jgi:hypothetical protein
VNKDMEAKKRYFSDMLSSLATIAAITLATAVFAAASEPEKEIAKQENTVTLEGTATLYGDWSCKGLAEIRVIPGKALEPVSGFPGGIQRAVVEVTVDGLDCGDKRMNEQLRKALKVKEYPKIFFQMNQYTLKGKGNLATASGELTIAGKTKPVEMEVDLRALANKGVRATGEVPIKMKEYGIKPPSILFGMLKASNDVTVKFDSLIQPPLEVK